MTVSFSVPEESTRICSTAVCNSFFMQLGCNLSLYRLLSYVKKISPLYSSESILLINDCLKPVKVACKWTPLKDARDNLHTHTIWRISGATKMIEGIVHQKLYNPGSQIVDVSHWLPQYGEKKTKTKKKHCGSQWLPSTWRTSFSFLGEL